MNQTDINKHSLVEAEFKLLDFVKEHLEEILNIFFNKYSTFDREDFENLGKPIDTKYNMAKDILLLYELFKLPYVIAEVIQYRPLDIDFKDTHPQILQHIEFTKIFFPH